MKCELFDTFSQKNVTLGEEQFLKQFPDPFLVSEGPVPPPLYVAATGAPPPRSGESTPQPGEANVGPGEKPERPSRRITDPIVVLVQGAKGPGLVTVGRTTDCDVTVEITQVSKRHAYFEKLETGWAVTDAASTNGTFVDGKRLPPHERHALSDSEAVRFSPDVCFRFFTAAAFFRYMSMRAKMKK